MSASSKLVTWGMVLADLVMWLAIVRRIWEMRSRRTGPHGSSPGSPGGTTNWGGNTAAGAAGGGAGADAAVGAAAARTSSGVIRPWEPDP